MRTSEIPCKDCKDRHLGCHDHCDRYKAYKTKSMKEKEAKDKYYDALRGHLKGVNVKYQPKYRWY